MADLKETAQQFANDLMAQNIAGLMLAFTPEGMGKAMALQAQQQAAGPQAPATSTEVVLQGEEGDDHLVDIVMKSESGDATIATKWRDVGGTWKVNDMAMKS